MIIVMMLLERLSFLSYLFSMSFVGSYSSFSRSSSSVLCLLMHSLMYLGPPSYHTSSLTGSCYSTTNFHWAASLVYWFSSSLQYVYIYTINKYGQGVTAHKHNNDRRPAHIKANLIYKGHKDDKDMIELQHGIKQ